MNTLLAFFAPGYMEMIIIGIIAVLLFGKKLPEVGRSLGRGIVEFKKGVRGIEDELESASSGASSVPSQADYNDIDDRDEATAPKFDPPSSEPKDETATA
ncbi:MAG: twin-arginine translocase TatA/TatE family subunit [Planctomycetales bacterium]